MDKKAKLLDRLGVSVIELHAVENPKIDSLLIKSVASAVKESAVCVPVALDPASVSLVWAARLVHRPADLRRGGAGLPRRARGAGAHRAEQRLHPQRAGRADDRG